MTTVDSDSQSATTVLRRYKFREAVQTDIGLRRNENQDAYGIAHTAGISLFVVADGMGGARGGATASAMAIHVIINEAIKSNGLITRPSLKQAIEKANAAIFSRAKVDEDLNGMGTTVVALAFVNECAIVAHVGDSRIYRLRDGEITQLTKDHTLVQELVDSGAIPPEEAENHPIAHMLTRSLGPAPDVDVEITALEDPTQVGDKFLLCSDGLYNLVSDEEIAQHMVEHSPEEASRKLIALALERGGTDNVTIETLEVCSAEDESVLVEYPDQGEMRFVFSEGVTTPELRSILEQAIERTEAEEMEELTGETLRSMPAVSGDLGAEDASTDEPDDEATDIELEEIAEEALLDVDSPEPSPAVVNRNAQMRMQASVVFVVLVTAAVFGLFLYQYSGIKEVDVSDNASVPKQNRDTTLAGDLGDLQPAPGSGLSGVEPIEPELVGTESIPSMVDVAQPDATNDKSKLFLQLLQIPDAPDVQVRDPEIAGMKPTRPIVWDNEEKKVEELLAAAKDGQEVAVDPTPAEPSSPKLLTSEERTEVLGQKRDLRDRIADIDSKLRVLSVPSKEKATEIAGLVQTKAQEKSDSIVELGKDIEAAQNELVIWNSRLDLTRGSSAVRLAEEISEEDEAIQPVFKAYSAASQAYDSDMEQWTKNANDFELSQRMGASGRERDRALNALQQSLALYVEGRIKKLGQTIAERRLTQDFLTIERDQLSRFEGYLKGYTELNATRRKELRDGYYKERGAYAEQLKELREQITDAHELELLLNQYRPAAAE